MPRRRRTPVLPALASALAIAVAAAGCWPRASLPRPHARWIMGTDAPAFDPDGPPDARRAAIERLLTRGLVVEDSTGRIVPAAAERIEVTPDSLAYTFHLRQGLRYVDGSPCSADDFRFALRAGLVRADHSTRRWLLAAVKGVDAVRVGKPLPTLGIDALDPGTLRLRLAVPDPLLLAKLAVPGTCDAWKHRGPRSWRSAVGLGPLQVHDVDSTWRMRLVRARSAFPRPGLADTMTVQFVPQASRVRRLLRVGGPDLVWPLPPGLLSEPIPAGYRRAAQPARPERWLVLVMRADLPPTHRLAARHALGHGINRPDLMRALAGQILEGGGWIRGAPSIEFPRLDPQEIELWRERAKLGRSFHVVMAYDANGVASEVARTMQGEWAAHSIYVEVNPLVGAKRRSEFLSGRSHLVLTDYQAPFDDASALLATLVMPLRGPAVGAVRTGWRTREFDRITLPTRKPPAQDPGAISRRLEEERVVLPIGRLPWVWIERAAGPAAQAHPHFGPECPAPAVPR